MKTYRVTITTQEGEVLDYADVAHHDEWTIENDQHSDHWAQDTGSYDVEGWVAKVIKPHHPDKT